MRLRWGTATADTMRACFRCPQGSVTASHPLTGTRMAWLASTVCCWLIGQLRRASATSDKTPVESSTERAEGLAGDLQLRNPVHACLSRSASLW